MFRKSVRRPYITCQSELQLYNNQKNYTFPFEEEVQINYKKLKEQNKRFIFRDYTELTFYEISLWICNDALHLIANEGVYYLMTFISLGILSVEFNENVDFIKIELKYIFDNELINKMKHRINAQSYLDIINDASIVKSYYVL